MGSLKVRIRCVIGHIARQLPYRVIGAPAALQLEYNESPYIIKGQNVNGPYCCGCTSAK